MTTDKSKDSKYVVLVCIMGMLLVLGSSIVKINILDIVYLIFIAICLIRYLIINNKQ